MILFLLFLLHVRIAYSWKLLSKIKNILLYVHCAVHLSTLMFSLVEAKQVNMHEILYVCK